MSKVNFKKVFILILTIICLFSNFKVIAQTTLFSIKKVKVVEKTNTVDVSDVSYDNLSINSDVKFHAVGDYITYEITLKNNTKEDYTLKSVSTTADNDYVVYTCENCTNIKISKGSEIKILLTAKYTNQVQDINERKQNIDFDLQLEIVDKYGNLVNPKTSDNIYLYIILAIISFVGLLITIAVLNKKTKAKVISLIVLGILILPTIVFAVGNTISLRFKNSIQLLDKVVIITKDANGEEQIEIIDYGEKISVPEPLEKNGYEFLGWYDENNNLLSGEIDANDDVKFIPKWNPNEYTITYDIGEGTLENENPSIYTPDYEDIQLNNPSREGYYFTGWTGSNGTTPQIDLIISKGSYGNKTYTANYAQYAPASLRTFSPGDSNVSWSFDSATGVYTITQKAKSSGWGQGVVCDNSTTDINWGKSYMLEFEIYTPNSYILKTDGNTMFSSNGNGNDIYGTSWVILDDVRTDGNGDGKLPQSHTIVGGVWHKVQMFLINNNASQNPNHLAIRSFSGFGLDLSSVTSNVTYQMRNLKSIVY